MILSNPSDQFIKAFFAVRSMLGGKVKKTVANNHLKSKYADLGSVFEAISPALDDQKIVPIQNATMVESGQVEVTTILMHESGESATFVSRIPLAKQDAQGYGSAFTYARRYSLMGIFGLVPADDDGNASRKTAKDVNKSLSACADVPAMDEVMKVARQYFNGDAASLRVIQAHYDKLKSDKEIGDAVPFNPLQKKQTQQVAPAEPQQPKGEDLNPETNF